MRLPSCRDAGGRGAGAGAHLPGHRHGHLWGGATFGNGFCFKTINFPYLHLHLLLQALYAALRSTSSTLQQLAAAPELPLDENMLARSHLPCQGPVSLSNTFGR